MFLWLALIYALDVLSSIGIQELNPLARSYTGKFVLWKGIALKIAALMVWQVFPQNYLTFTLFAAPSALAAINNRSLISARVNPRTEKSKPRICAKVRTGKP